MPKFKVLHKCTNVLDIYICVCVYVCMCMVVLCRIVVNSSTVEQTKPYTAIHVYRDIGIQGYRGLFVPCTAVYGVRCTVYGVGFGVA
jgi:hypothetical protein